MIVLAVDTSAGHGSLALARGDELLEVVALPLARHSTALHGEIVRLLERHGLTSREIQGYGVTVGPGSFTGVRVGLVAVKGLAEVSGKPVVAVSTLETVAAAAHAPSLAHSAPLSSGSPLAPLLDARRGQIFGAAYREQEGQFQLLVEQTVCSMGSFLARLRTSGLEELAFCGPDLERFVPEIEKAGWGLAPRVQVSPYLAGSLAPIAVRRLEKGLGVAAGSLEANYVRSSDAELFFKE